MIDNGIKPVYVFDGKPPTMKSGELAKRLERRKEAESKLEAAKESGDAQNEDRFSRRTVKVTKEHNEECQKLLTLMGIPFLIVSWVSSLFDLKNNISRLHVKPRLNAQNYARLERCLGQDPKIWIH